MNTPLISVIVPIYNAAKTIDKCISSIQHQICKSWELILVDDGSKDNSAEICAGYAEADQRIKFIKKENGGVSSARNVGLNHASGKWVTFIDSDDWIEGEIFSKVEKWKDAELLVFDCNHINRGVSSITHYDENNLSGRAFEKNVYKYVTQSVLLGPWAKFFRVDILNIHNIRFDEKIHWGEDRLFNISYLSHVRSISFMGIGNYVYNDSPTDSGIMKYKVDIKTIDDLYNKMKSYTDNMKAKHMAKSYSSLWTKVEKIAMLSSGKEEERRLFYKDKLSMQQLFNMRIAAIPLYLMCAFLPQKVYKKILAPLLKIQ